MLARRSSSASIPLDLASLVALWLETIFYGVFVVLFFITIHSIIYQRASENINKPMLTTAVLIFILTTAHLAMDLSRCLDAFIYTTPGGAIPYFSLLSQPKHVAKNCIYALETFLADALVVYRAYIVWGRDFRAIALPTLLLIGNLVTGIGVVVQLSRHTDLGTNVFADTMTVWVTGFFSFTLATNVVCTALIAYKIHAIQKQFGSNENLSSLIQIVVESASVYSATLVIMLTLYALHSNAQYTVLDPISPIIGIVFSLIIIRVALGLSATSSNPGGGTTRVQDATGNWITSGPQLSIFSALTYDGETKTTS